MQTHALAQRVGELLRAEGLTLALAESCTGGLVGDYVTDIPGSSDYFLGAIVAYSYAAKQKLLRVRPTTLATEGAVSPQCAAEMAQGARQALGADIAVSVTGIAGPGGALPGKPVGLTYIHLSAADAELGRRRIWSGGRRANKQASVLATLQLLAGYLQDRASQGRSAASSARLPGASCSES